MPLWGTIVFPDETAQLSQALRSQVIIHSPHSRIIAGSPGLPWQKREASKHLVHVIAEAVSPLAEGADARQGMISTVAWLRAAVALHAQIRDSGLMLRDNTGAYQSAWTSAGTRILAQNADDYDWLEALSGP